jgi:catechol 2,3-dioxygenase-like lactoylglutathione lyase family enzyme
VLLGDAVHATTPHLGQGAGMAIEDSIVLADELTRADTPEDAFTAYRARRFERCAYIVRESLAICHGQIGKGPPVDNAKATTRCSKSSRSPFEFQGVTFMSRVTEIRYVGYGVPDLAAERAFYNDQWKLVEVGEQDGMVHFAAEGGTEHHVVRLRQNDDTRIDVIALAADTNADVDALHEKIAATGARIIFAPRNLNTLGGGYGFRFFSPDGLPFEISAGVARREPARSPIGKACR